MASIHDKRCALTVLTVLAVALAGCEATGPYDARFGDAVRQAAALQTLRPNAPASARDLTMDGETAVSAVQRHRGTFKEPPPTFQTLGIGGSGGGGR